MLYVTNSLPPRQSDLPKRVASAACCILDEGKLVAVIRMTRSADTTRIELFPAGDPAVHRMETDRAGSHSHDIAHLLGMLGLDRVTARSLAFDAAIVLDCALDDMEIDNYEARRIFPLRVALMTNSFKI